MHIMIYEDKLFSEQLAVSSMNRHYNTYNPASIQSFICFSVPNSEQKLKHNSSNTILKILSAMQETQDDPTFNSKAENSYCKNPIDQWKLTTPTYNLNK